MPRRPEREWPAAKGMSLKRNPAIPLSLLVGVEVWPQTLEQRGGKGTGDGHREEGTKIKVLGGEDLPPGRAAGFLLTTSGARMSGTLGPHNWGPVTSLSLSCQSSCPGLRLKVGHSGLQICDSAAISHHGKRYHRARHAWSKVEEGGGQRERASQCA